MKSFAFAIVLATVALAAGVAPAAAKSSECNGLQTCVPIAGPWVVVPVSGGTARPTAEYQLSCPPGFIVGGVDAEVSDRAIDVTFLGGSGSPVNPGITTGRAAVFLASYVGTGASVASFRPHLGCIPASGGGARVPTVVRVFPVGKPVVWRSRNTRLRHGREQTIGLRCAPGERPVGSWDAVGFYTTAPPTPRLVSLVTRGARTVRSGKVQVVARTGDALRSLRAVVQVGAVCAVGT